MLNEIFSVEQYQMGNKINVKKAPFVSVQIKYIHLYTTYISLYIIHIISIYPILYVPRVCARIFANILSV